MEITFTRESAVTEGALAVAIGQEKELFDPAASIDERSGGLIRRALEVSAFTGKREDILPVFAPEGLGVSRILLVGVGDVSALDELSIQNIGGALVAALNGMREGQCRLDMTGLKDAPMEEAAIAAHLAFGARLRAYRFDKYRASEKEEDKPSLARLDIRADDWEGAEQAFAPLNALADGVSLTRDLNSEPANVLYPAELAQRCRQLAGLGIDVEVFEEGHMAELGMEALLAVGRGSDKASQLVVMRWTGAGPGREDDPPIALVGKGVTFDTGGISIKPSSGMEDMKWDMGGAGAVIGTMQALAARDARVNVVGLVGLVENMPSGSAQRPGDIVKSMSGQTIEVLNTDAEGRLVLADVLWYCQETFAPRAVIDLATLTGAVMVALGQDMAGVMGNDDQLVERLIAAGKASGDSLWQLPLTEAFDKDLNSDAADIKNIGSSRYAGSSIGGQFLKRFIKDDTVWAHIDIAGVTWSKKDQATRPKGATGFGVRLLDKLIATHYEQ